MKEMKKREERRAERTKKKYWLDKQYSTSRKKYEIQIKRVMNETL